MDQAQFGDQLLALEHLHLTKLMLWAGISVLVASLIVALLRARRLASPLLEHFAYQSLGWGLLELIVGVWGRSRLELRDLGGATQLDRALWFSIGLEVGVAITGLAIAVIGWRLARLGLVGAGVAVVVQGLALALLHVQLSAGILR